MKKLKNGWVEGSVQDFLELSAAEAAYIETRVALARRLREERNKKHLTQFELATVLHTSQSRIAKMEKADPSVSLDLVIQALFKIGMTRKDLAAAI
ncbi:MAG: XRE family transcriptional regulator [bacterium]|jgi:DNA-binding XRE family transcriptional regulator